MASRPAPTHSGMLRRVVRASLPITAAVIVVIWGTGAWSIGASAAQPTVGLGTASSFAVLAGSTVTNTGSSVISGALGVSPGSAVTGFPPGLVTGAQHVGDPVALQAQSDLTTAYNDAAGQSPTASVTADLGGQMLVPGVYNSASSMGLTGAVTLNGENNTNAVFIFQAGTTLTTASNSSVNLINGAQACNVFWQVGSSATLGTNTFFVGSILALTSASLLTGTSVDGRILARNGQVSLETNRVTVPTCAATTTTSTTTTSTTTPPSTTSTAGALPAQQTTTTSVPAPTVTQISPPWGAPAGGMTVTVSGTGFSTTAGATTIGFGPNQRVLAGCVSTVSCTAVTPPDAPGWDAVTATVDGQTSSTTGAPVFAFVEAGTVEIATLSSTDAAVSAAPSAALANTGADIDSGVMAGLALIALGGVLLWVSRRRTAADCTTQSAGE